MTVRQIIQLAGTLDIAGLPQLDVTQDEISIANMPTLKLWAATAAWGASTDDLGFEDRVSGKKIPLNGAGTSARLVSVFDGSQALSLAASAVIKDDGFSTTGSFTIAMNLCASSDDLGVGPASSAVLPVNGQSYWFVSGAGGKLRIGTTNFSTAFSDYLGPLLSRSAWLRLILRYDRISGSMTLFVNGTQQAKLTNDSLKTLSLAPGLVLGGLITTSTTPASPLGFMRSPLGFTSSLSDSEIALIDRYLSKTLY